MPAGTDPTAPKATMAFAGTGTTGPGRVSRAALARCRSMFPFAVFMTDQTPLKLGCPPMRSIAPLAGVLWAAAGGAAWLWLSAATEPVKVTRAHNLIFLFRTPPQFATPLRLQRISVCNATQLFADSLFFVRIRTVFRRARAARSHEYLTAIGECDIASVGLAGRTAARVLGTVTANDDQLTRFQRIARQALAQQRVGCARLDHPLLIDPVRGHDH